MFPLYFVLAYTLVRVTLHYIIITYANSKTGRKLANFNG